MIREMCKSKIHRATITEADLNYVGSITIDRHLMEHSNLLPYEKVQVVNITNGQRFETYVIEGERHSGCICVNGAAARLVAVDDLIIIISYAQYNEQELKNFEPQVVHVDKNNRIVDICHREEALSVV